MCRIPARNSQRQRNTRTHTQHGNELLPVTNLVHRVLYDLSLADILPKSRSIPSLPLICQLSSRKFQAVIDPVGRTFRLILDGSPAILGGGGGLSTLNNGQEGLASSGTACRRNQALEISLGGTWSTIGESTPRWSEPTRLAYPKITSIQLDMAPVMTITIFKQKLSDNEHKNDLEDLKSVGNLELPTR